MAVARVFAQVMPSSVAPLLYHVSINDVLGPLSEFHFFKLT